jgi:stearoyl-CoA desaturase (Delta-9 desaturase)
MTQLASALSEERLQPTRLEQLAIGIFVVVPFLAVLAAVPLFLNRGMTVLDLTLAVVMYCVSGLGITVGFHRYLTHGSFKANQWLRAALAIAGSFSLQGDPLRWVADHRRHHALSDKEGDPHSPWRYGRGVKALTKGFFHSHVGWLFTSPRSSQERYVPDLLADAMLVRIAKLFPVLVTISLLLPALIGGLITQTWQGAWSAFFWASLVRVSLLHHMTWSINSVCHIAGEKPFHSRDESTNFWPLALLTFGESWHNLHHAEPTSARHGVLRGQIDLSAGLIRLFERLGWATNVRWIGADRIESRRTA